MLGNKGSDWSTLQSAGQSEGAMRMHLCPHGQERTDSLQSNWSGTLQFPALCGMEVPGAPLSYLESKLIPEVS